VIKLAVNGPRQVANHDDILFIPLKAVHRLDLQGEAQTVAALRKFIHFDSWQKLTTRKAHIWVVQL